MSKVIPTPKTRPLSPNEKPEYGAVVYYRQCSGTVKIDSEFYLLAYVRDTSDRSLRVYIPGWLGLQWEPRERFLIPA